MPRYQPRFSNGKVVPLQWPTEVYRRFNHFCWPLEDNVNGFGIFVDRFLCAIVVFISVQHNDAEFRYLRENVSNIDNMLTGVPTLLILIEVQLRGFQLAWHKNTKFKSILKKFYADIYISKTESSIRHKKIFRQLRPTRIICLLYIIVLLSKFILVPIFNLIYKQKNFLYEMIFPFDVRPLYIYLPLLATNFWMGIIVDTMIFGESYLLCEFMMHLNGRYLILKQDIQNALDDLSKEGNYENVATQYREKLIKIIKRNTALNAFADQIEAEFTYRVFVMFSLSTVLLCVLSFKTYTNPSENITYIFWFISKTLEMLAFGNLGSTLETTTNELSQMYYESNWEQIVYHSTNSRENIRLMKFIVVAIEINAKPFNVTGLKYFRITSQTVLKILQGAYSYFTFLTTMG